MHSFEMGVQPFRGFVVHVAISAFEFDVGVIIFVMVEEIRMRLKHSRTGGTHISAMKSGDNCLFVFQM